MEQRLEQVDGKSEKFWEIRVRGSTQTLRFGRLGTDGQTKTKTFSSAQAAKRDAQERIRKKLAGGYARVGSTAKRATKPTANKKTSAKKSSNKKSSAKKTSNKKTANKTSSKKTSSKKTSSKKTSNKKPSNKGLRPLAVVQGKRDSSRMALYLDGRSVYFVGLDDYDEDMHEQRSQGTPWVELEDSELERWTFASPALAKKAAAALVEAPANGKVLAASWGSPRIDAASPWPRSYAVRPTIGTFTPATQGPVTLAVNAAPSAPLPRPPSHCAACGLPMVSTYALQGPLDPRLGKQPGIFVSLCPGSMSTPYCRGSVEVIVQTKDAKPRAEHYLMAGSAYHFLFLSEQVDPIGSALRWVVTEHRGIQGLPGLHRSERFKGRKAAEAHIAAELGRLRRGSPAFEPVDPRKIRRWYLAVLAELHHVYRCEAMDPPRTLRFAPALGPMEHASDGYGRVCAPVAPRFDVIGGAPWYIQAEASHRPRCDRCKQDMMFVFQFAEGDAHYASHVNAGDVGAYYVFACPRCRGPFGHALFECH